MKVFANTRKNSYSGGLILVAANSREEAIDVFHHDKNFDWMYQEDYEIDGLFDDYIYYNSGWFEMTMLTANVDKPQVLIEEGHSE